MYRGICVEHGKRVYDADAFMYAIEKITTDEITMNGFLREFDDLELKTHQDIRQLREDVVEWFFSGNWIYEEE